ncbi:hypothetical protein V2J09_009327, partial [Rumex salicifolius]
KSLKGDFQEKLKGRFLDVCCVETRGFTGGLCLFWDNNSVLVSAIKKGHDFIHAIIKKGKAEIQYIFVYAPPTESMMEVMDAVNGSLIITGDFNCILSTQERIGGSGNLHPDSHLFQQLLD